MKKQLVKIGIVFIFISVFLITVSLTCNIAKAESASGTWTGSCTDQTGAADFYYTATLTLSGGSSVSGTLELYCTDVNVKISGFEDSRNMIGTTTTAQVDGTMLGSSLTLNVYSSGGTFTFYLTVSGGKMTGGSQYTGAASETNTWTFDLTSGGGGLFSGFGGFDFGMPDLTFLIPPATVIGAAGGIVGLSASFLPAPSGMRNMRSIKGRTRSRPSPHHPNPPVTHIPLPYHNVPRPQPKKTPKPEPTPVRQPQPPPLLNPALALAMPTIPDPRNGNSLVPWDAPMQCPSGADPPDYPYPKGTNASMRCPYCGCTTLSPFNSGWFCTNSLCPARHEWVQKGCTHDQFNHLTWRGL